MIVTNQRIRKLRRELDITQQEFAERIGVSRANIGKYETGISEPSAAVLSLICREFDVREEWLRTGEGEMFKPKPSDILDQLAYKYQFSNADYVIAEKFVSLSPNKRKEMVENVFGFLHEIEAALSDTNPYAPAYEGTEPPMPMDKFMESMKSRQKEKAEAVPEKTVEEPWNKAPAAGRTMQEMSREDYYAEIDRQLDAEKEAEGNAPGYGRGSSGKAAG